MKAVVQLWFGQFEYREKLEKVCPAIVFPEGYIYGFTIECDDLFQVAHKG